MNDIDSHVSKRGQARRNSGDTTEPRVSFAERAMKAVIDHFPFFCAKNRQRVRRQWEPTPDDKMNTIYRSFSTLDISPKQKLDSKDRHLVTSLPPIRANGLTKASLGTAGHSSQRDLTKNERRHRNNSVEWVVTRPHKRKPKDVFTLEGVMDMETTFASTYDATAKELQMNTTPEPTYKPIVTCTTTYRDVLPTSRPSRRRRKERPKTTLKVGGEGNYATVNRDSFKNFIVVPDGNNHDNEDGLERHRMAVGTAAQIPNGKHISSAELSPVSNATSSVSPGSPTSAVMMKEAGQQTNREERESFDERSRTNRAEEADAITEMTRHDHRNGKSDSEPGFKAEHEVASEHPGGYAAAEAVMKQKVKAESGEEEANETRLPRSQSSSLQADETRTGRSEQRSQSRSRHLSLPRTKHKHKNESQLRFDGAMDFDTTTRRLFRNCEETVEKEGMKRRVDRARDLFKPSDEVELFHSHQKDKFDGSTTYSLCYQNKQYCPVMDLNTSQSDYTFREETGRHRYYCDVNKLS